MTRFALFSIIFITNCCLAQENEIKQVVDEFFIGLNLKDTTSLKKYCHSEITLQTIVQNKQGEFLQKESFSHFLKSIGNIPENLKIEEKIQSYDIQIDGSLAHVWMLYEFFVNGELSHKGANSITLCKENEIWQIVYIIDTRRK